MTRFLVQAAGGYGLTPWAFRRGVFPVSLPSQSSALTVLIVTLL